MRVFLTGASGFLGARVLPLLSEHEVMCLTREPGRLPSRGGVIPLAGNLRDTDAWQSAMREFAPECCIHLAWEGLPDYSAAQCDANLASSSALVALLAQTGISRVVVAGSCWEYGRATGPMSEGDAPIECGLFAETKSKLRLTIEALAEEHGFQSRWARVFFSYGLGQRESSLIPHLRASYASGGAPDVRQPGVTQDFIYVDDVATGLVALAEADDASGIFNLGTGVPTTVGHIANTVARHFGRAETFAEDSQSGFWADTTRTERVLGWRARTGIAEGIQRTLDAVHSAQ